MKKQLAFVVDRFALGTAGQQLLDRFLLGYPRAGAFHRPEAGTVWLWSGKPSKAADLIAQRVRRGLKTGGSLEEIVAAADAVIVVPGERSPQRLVRSVLENMRSGASCFVYGPLGNRMQALEALEALVRSRNLRVMASTATPVTWRLPPVDPPKGCEISQALILIRGDFPAAEVEGLEGLTALVAKRKGGEKGIHTLRRLVPDGFWELGHAGVWSWDLLASAISRSNSPLGDSVKDGRTQDIVGLGMLPALVKRPRGWVLEHAGGLRSAILVLNGAVNDDDFAVRFRDGSLLSAQIYRPPAPYDHQFSRLAETVEAFLWTGQARWPMARERWIAGCLEIMQSMEKRGERVRERLDLSASFEI